MAEQQDTPKPVQHIEMDLPEELIRHSTMENLQTWLVEEGPWWLCSFVFHLVLFLGLALFATIFAPAIVPKMADDSAPEFDEAKVEEQAEQKKIEKFELADAPVEPTKLDPMELDLKPPATAAVTEKVYDDSDKFTEGGGAGIKTDSSLALGGLSASLKGIGPGAAVEGAGLTNSAGLSNKAGAGGAGGGFAGRSGHGRRKAMAGRDGTTQQSERAVAAALNWLARHQNNDGSWSLKAFPMHCGKGTPCDGFCKTDRVSAATALALLPFLAAGTTPDTRGATFRKTVAKGIRFLCEHQNRQTGDMRINVKDGSNMYDHGLCAIALCECYGMSPNGGSSKEVRAAAQAALNFTMLSQDPMGGGWRYEPRQPGDTSVVGWQVMALKSGKMANLDVQEAVLAKAKKFLDTAKTGKQGGLFLYFPGGKADERGGGPGVTSVGLLCRQYMGAARTDPAMAEGTAFLMGNLPNIGARNAYYWYYATQVMHNQPGADWDKWNRAMRRTLIESQCQDNDGCAVGSWSPTRVGDKKIKDPWADAGGRIMETSLSTLTLEVYYRYLPLYKLDKASEVPVVTDASDVETKTAKPAFNAKARIN